jgi:hypothetical protein
MVVLLRPPEAAADGNLTLVVPCSAELSAPGTYVKGKVRLWVGSELYQTEAEGWDYVFVYGDWGVSARAAPEDRAITCTIENYYWNDGWIYLGDVGYGGILPHSGPGSGYLQIASFITQNWLSHPYEWWTIYEGDYRWFEPSSSHSRTITGYDIANPAVNNNDDWGPPTTGVGLTVEYDYDTSLQFYPFGPLSWDAENDWQWGDPMKREWAFADASGIACTSIVRTGTTANTSKNRVRCYGSSSNPLVPGSPPIDYDLTFNLEWGLRRVEFTVEGCTDGFPAYESYLNNQTLFNREDNGNVLSLFASCGEPISASGEIQ